MHTGRTKKINDKEYWKDRHQEHDDLEASGLKGVGLRANKYIYKILAEQYKVLLEKLDMKKVSSILDCGFGDGYFIDFFSKNYPSKKLHGIDISIDAQTKTGISKKAKLHTGDLSEFKLNKKFQIVHSFDVLYHILDDEDYISSLRNMVKHSDKYIILHERFFPKYPIITSKHVRMRKKEVTEQLLNANGFHLTAEIPTHFVAMRLLTFKLNLIIPKTLYRIDKFIATHFSVGLQERLASHRIRVYEKAT